MSDALAITLRIAVVAVALWVATLLVDGIELGPGTTAARVGTLIGVAVIFGLINAVLKPLIKVVGCPFYILTLGIVGLFVNALLFMLVGYIAAGSGCRSSSTGSGRRSGARSSWPSWGSACTCVIPDRFDQR